MWIEQFEICRDDHQERGIKILKEQILNEKSKIKSNHHLSEEAQADLPKRERDDLQSKSVYNNNNNNR